MPDSTESQYTGKTTIDRMEPDDAVSALLDAQCRAAAVVKSASVEITCAARDVARALANGNRVIYCGAGSSGLMAMADALEVPGTFGVARESVMAIVAGGRASLTDLAGGYEDDADAGALDVRVAGVSPGDCVILVAASGRTPYTLGAAQAAKAAGATVIALANNPDTPLLEGADIPIFLATPPEPVAGSTQRDLDDGGHTSIITCRQ
jgi:N-acetylmuramic acid 6-phosphate etherase